MGRRDTDGACTEGRVDRLIGNYLDVDRYIAKHRIVFAPHKPFVPRVEGVHRNCDIADLGLGAGRRNGDREVL